MWSCPTWPRLRLGLGSGYGWSWVRIRFKVAVGQQFANCACTISKFRSTLCSSIEPCARTSGDMVTGPQLNPTKQTVKNSTRPDLIQPCSPWVLPTHGHLWCTSKKQTMQTPRDCAEKSSFCLFYDVLYCLAFRAVVENTMLVAALLLFSCVSTKSR